MLVVDELKKNEPQLRVLALVLAAGLCILFVGLWWVQVVSAGKYKENQVTQSSRTVRLPAVRGKILDRENRVLAENQPRFNLCLYLEDLSDRFKAEYSRIRPREVVMKPPPFWKFWDRTPTRQTNGVKLKQNQIGALEVQARCNVAFSIVRDVGQILGQPVPFDATNFIRHYMQKRAQPYPILKNLTPTQIARFQEKLPGDIRVDLETESVRNYPLGDTATHLLGYLRLDDSSTEGEDAYFNYRLPDYRGVVGLEYGYDDDLRGRAGAESVVINSLGYRQSENVWITPEPGQNLVLTIDLDLQKAAQTALASHLGPNARAAAVVMDVRNGDVLAMASSPTINPNSYFLGFTPEENARRKDDRLRPEINRATQENYAPGSIFKVVVGLALLEGGLNPDRHFEVQADTSRPGKGCYYVGKRKIEDTAPPGDYTFRRALVRSSNSYFIDAGLQFGIERIVNLAEKFHFGERTGLPTRQETAGNMPDLQRIIRRGWSEGDTANICIGQGEVAVTPLQMAVAYSAIANGGTVYWPRLVMRMEPQDPTRRDAVTNFPSAMLRDQIGVSARSLRILREAMLAETEDSEGTGQRVKVPGLLICGKTGTAQVPATSIRAKGWNYWFASFAPYENPRYSVVVLVESENPGSGGTVAAPIAQDIYEAILQNEKAGAAKTLAAN